LKEKSAYTQPEPYQSREWQIAEHQKKVRNTEHTIVKFLNLSIPKPIMANSWTPKKVRNTEHTIIKFLKLRDGAEAITDIVSYRPEAKRHAPPT
jgi:hypothetical protein